MRKRLLVALSLTLMLSALTACGGNDENNGGKNESGSANSGNLKPITFSMQVDDAKLNWDNPVTDVLSDKFALSIDYQPIITSADQKHDLWIASGDYPDILYISPLQIGRYRDAGDLIPLEDLIDEYGPNIKEKFGKYYDLLKDKDGHIYSLYNVNLSEEVPASATASFQVQYDVLKEAGYPEITTLGQLYDVIKAYYEKHPTIDGKPVVPFSGFWGGDGALTVSNPVISAAGYPDQGMYIINDQNEVEFALTKDFAKQYYHFLNRMQKDGMLDKDIFNQGNESLNRIAQGRVLAAYMPNWLMNSSEQSLKASGQTNRMFAKLPILIDPSVEDHSFVTVPTGSSSNWAITNNAKNPERIIQMIDYLFSDEGQILINWGIEGRQYTTQDGKRKLLPEWIEKKAANPDIEYSEGTKGPYTRFSIGDGARLADGDYATPNTKEFVASNYDDTTKQVLSEYGKTTWSEFLPEPEKVPGMIWQLNEPEGAQPIFKKIQEALTRETPKMIMAKSDEDFDKAWDNWINAVDKAGKDKLEQIYTEAWQAFVDDYDQATAQ